MSKQKAKTERIAALSCAPVEIDSVLWTAKEVGQYFRLSEYTAQQKIVTQPDFPIAIVPVGSSKRWIAGEVIAWAKKKRR